MTRVAAALGLVLLASVAIAQDARRTAAIGRVDEVMAPHVDGDLSDPCWTDAPTIGELVTVEPWEGRAPSQRTVIKLLHDRHNLYIALWCDDDTPAAIRATQRARDAQLDPDDRVEIMVDPFENRRTAYFFQIGAGGSIGDALVSANGGRFDKPWDTIWSGSSRVTERGWQAEIAIPFRSIPRKQNGTDWGFNVRRIRRAGNEQYQWANARQAVPFFRVSEFGTVHGFGVIDDGLGVDFVPYVAAGVRRDRTAATDKTEFDVDGGADLFYRLAPELNLAVTTLTDFAETESDSRQINLDRFPLFFPEKRDFFLEGASYFGFGAGADEGEAVTLLPFFSRRIGLASSGSKIPLTAGIKLTGEAGPLELGLLDVETEAQGGISERNLAVARVKYSLAEQTTVGLIGTNGRPEDEGSSQLLGFDAYHRVPRFVGDLDLQLYASAIGTHASGAGGDGQNLALEARARGREWRVGVRTRWTSADFLPDLGFVRRTDTKEWFVTPRWQPRLADGSAARNLDVQARVRWSQSWETGSSQDLEFALPFAGVELHDGDRFGFTASRRFQRVEQDFTLFDGTTTIAAGDYWATRTGIKVDTSDGRPFSATATSSLGDFFAGRSWENALDLQWRTGALLHLGAKWSTAIADLEQGNSFTTQVAEARADLHFDPRTSLRNLCLFDNESQALGWQSRLRWIYAPGCDFFAVAGLGWQREDDGSLLPTQQSLTFKVGHTLRF